MTEILLILTTMCPSGLSAPCYERRTVENMKVISSTYVALCDAQGGHKWEWQIDPDDPHFSDSGTSYGKTFFCKVCGVKRRKVIRTKEVTETREEKFWEDTGEEVFAPSDDGVYRLFRVTPK